MRRRLFLLTVSLFAAICAGANGQNKSNASNTQSPNSSKPLTARQIVEKVLPSVVVIIAQDENGEPIGQGSGFFYKPGLVATNLHVFTRASQAYVKVLNGGIMYKVVEVVGIDMRRDLCVVRVDEHSTPGLALNSANKPGVGDEVFVISNPKGLEGSVSKGIVSSVRKDIGLLQIDAPISPGSSGGAVVNDRAEVVGVAVSSVVGGQNLNFAVPVEYLSALKLNFKVPVHVAGAFSLNDRDKEKLRGPVQSVTETFAFFGYDKSTDKYFEKPAETTGKTVYDLDGNAVESWFYSEGRLVTKIVETYDEQGFKKRQIVITGFGTESQSERTYEVTLAESMTDKVNKRMFSGSRENGTGGESVYDRDGNEIERTIKFINGNLQRSVFTYGRNGFLSEEKIYLNGKLKSINRSTYETDEYGNWVKRYETGYDVEYAELGFSPNSVSYREIKYFGEQ